MLFPIFDQLYIFQLGEYNTINYIELFPRFFFKRNLQKHDFLKKTPYIKILIVTSLIINLLIALFTITFFNFSLLLNAIFIVLIFLFFQPFGIIAASLFWKPYYKMKGHLLKKQAKNKIQLYKKLGLKIIAITGSFGKTTTKHYIYELIKNSYITQVIPGNINTSIGITNWVNSSLKKNTEMLITEMGAYHVGEIRDSVDICPPDISVITAIGEQHLDKFKSLENIVSAKMEIFDYVNQNTLRICPAELKDVLKERNYKIHYSKSKKSLPTSIKLAIDVAKKLNVRNEVISASIKNLTPPSRRGDIKKHQGFFLIDNSYNISLNSALYNLNNAKDIANDMNRKVIVITAGIPEGGHKSKYFNKTYAKQLSKKADYVIILNSIFKKYYIEGLGNHKYIIKKSIAEALNFTTKTFSEKKYIVLMEPELTDLYY
jgi:UDP-N-acetylmuramoyl-tripeptide--D-alanyl-D-alanine ligase